MDLEKLIFDKYQPTKDKCRPTVNPDVAHIEDRDNLEVACLIFNFKKLYWTKWPKVIEDLDPNLKALLSQKNIHSKTYSRYFLSKKAVQDNKTIMLPTFNQEEHIILFSDEGKLNALLLLKWHMELNLKEFDQPGSWAESNNPYLLGKILEYDESDIKFYYKIAGFRQYLENILNKSNNITLELHFVHWPAQLKTEFKYYVNYVFNKAEIYQLYKRDQNEAQIWLEKNKDYTQDQLEVQTKNLIAKIQELATNYKAKK